MDELEEQLPTTLDDLVDWLDAAFPDKIVTAELSPYDQGRQHGVIEIVRLIKQLQKELKET